MAEGTAVAEREIFNIPVRRLAAKLSLLVQREVLRPFGLRIQEWRVLWSLVREGDAHLREIARRASVDPSHVSRLLGKLEKDKIVERFPDPDDGRRTMFRITPKGRALYDEVRPVATDISLQFQELYSDAEYAQLMELLERASVRADQLLGGVEVEELVAD
ncbi:MAG: MarR family transcriptional regulator [Pseudomonadota bacterium]|nr:MarR family transcriptional regulator [Pseudomonadota bacterium]